MKSMLSEALCEIRGLLNQLLEVLAGENGEEWLTEFKKFLRKEPCWKKVFLRLISTDDLVLDACDGTEVLANAKDVFDCIDLYFNIWGADEPGVPTAKTLVNITKW